MKKVLHGFMGPAFALMRIVAGFLFLCHGAQKLFGAFGGMDGSGGTVELASLIGLAGIIEFFGGLLVALGLFGSLAAFICSGEMAVGYFMGHASKALWPIENGGEMAALYAFVFLFIAAHGSGPWSLAKTLKKPALE